ncbi:hypothetical protein D1007_52331 [Hordeum vulgare]|nr:hypothetical protein D1007_52331 [Hordeum vulgare]
MMDELHREAAAVRGETPPTRPTSVHGGLGWNLLDGPQVKGGSAVGRVGPGDLANLCYGTRSAELTLSLNKLIVNNKVPIGDPTTVATLSTVWIQIRWLPLIARKDRVIRNMSKMLGMIIEVDLNPLAR